MFKWMKISLAVMLILLPLGAVSCSLDNHTAIDTVVTEFVTAYQNQQYSKCLDYMSANLRKSSGDQALINRMRVARLFAGDASIRSIGEPSISGKTATVWVDMVGFLNVTNSVQLSLVKEGLSWKISSF